MAKNNKPARPSDIVKRIKDSEADDLGYQKLSSAELMSRLGIKMAPPSGPKVTIYKLVKHDRSTVDHVKHPKANFVPYEETPLFATWEEADRLRQGLEKKDRAWVYKVVSQKVPQKDVPDPVMKKIQARPGGAW